MSDSVWPHRWQPTRLPCPWDSPGKNSGVGCHFLLQCMKVKSDSEVTQSCRTPSDPMDCSLPGSSIHAIVQARVLEWGAIAFSNAWKWKVKVKVKFYKIPCSTLLWLTLNCVWNTWLKIASQNFHCYLLPSIDYDINAYSSFYSFAR